MNIRKELSVMAGNLLCASDDLKTARGFEETSDFDDALVSLHEVRAFCRSVAISADAVIHELEQIKKEKAVGQ